MGEVAWHLVPLRAVVICALLLGMLGAAWMLGYDFVRRHSPALLPRFYIVCALARFLFVGTLAGVYILGVSHSTAESKAFALMILGMYALMMLVTLIIKH